MRALALVLVLAAGPACHKKNDHPTPKGAVVLSWDTSKSTRESIKAAKIGERKKVQLDLVDDHQGEDAIVKLALALETATVTLHEGGEDHDHDTIVSLTATVTDGADFTFTKGHCEGPNYQLTAPGDAPRLMILDCFIHTNKPDYDTMITFQLLGDGTLMAAPPAQKVK